MHRKRTGSYGTLPRSGRGGGDCPGGEAMVSCGGSAEGGVFLRWRRGGHVPGGGERSRCTCFPGGSAVYGPVPRLSCGPAGADRCGRIGFQRNAGSEDRHGRHSAGGAGGASAQLPAEKEISPPEKRDLCPHGGILCRNAGGNGGGTKAYAEGNDPGKYASAGLPGAVSGPAFGGARGRLQ